MMAPAGAARLKTGRGSRADVARSTVSRGGGAPAHVLDERLNFVVFAEQNSARFSPERRIDLFYNPVNSLIHGKFFGGKLLGFTPLRTFGDGEAYVRRPVWYCSFMGSEQSGKHPGRIFLENAFE